MNIDNHTRELLQALQDGKKLLYRGRDEPTWDYRDWLPLITWHADRVIIAPEPKITTMYFCKRLDGFLSVAGTVREGCDTHYMQLDETGKQVAFGLIEELKA